MNHLKERVQLSFTVFAMFFGAGNLIFPAFLSYQAGSNLVAAFAGFAMTAIGCPVLSLLAISKAGSLEKLSERVNPIFSKIFTIAIYLAIGPCLAIPRTASTSYEMISIAFSLNAPILGILYSIVFFAAAGVVALHPEKLTKSLGRILAPILIILIIVLFIGTLGLEAVWDSPQEVYQKHPFATGFREGYQTMDAIAGLVFGVIVAMNVKRLIPDEKEGKKETLLASIGGGFLLLIIYLILAGIGTKGVFFTTSPETGADILSGAATFISPNYGKYLIAIIFVLACFNTSVGLLSSCGEYFTKLFPKLSRGKWIAIFAIVSAVIANAGLGMIIKLSSPVLELIYPTAITLIILAFIPAAGKACYVLSASVSIISSLLTMLGLPLPFASAGFGWVLPTIAAAIIGIAFSRKSLQ